MISWVLLIAFSASQPKGSIAFLAEDENGGGAVHLASIEAKTVERIGPGPYDGPPVWSPDGRLIAFTTDNETKRTIGVWSMDEGRLILLGLAEPASGKLAWAPDGTRIAYEDGSTDEWRIGVVEIESGRVEIWGGGAKGLVSPVWITGRELIRKMVSDDADIDLGSAAIFDAGMLLAVAWQPLATPPTTDPVLLTRNKRLAVNRATLPTPAPHAEWAIDLLPNANAMAYESDDGGNREIFAYSANRKPICLSNHRAADWNPVWSPSGFWVLFESLRNGRRGLYRAHRETARVETVSAVGGASCWSGSWSPDSQWVVFVSDFGDAPHIWIAPSKGGEIRRLTSTDPTEGAPAWQPAVR